MFYNKINVNDSKKNMGVLSTHFRLFLLTLQSTL